MKFYERNCDEKFLKIIENHSIIKIMNTKEEERE